MLKKLGWGGTGSRAIDIQFVLAEPGNDGRIVQQQRWARQVDTSSTTYGTLKEVARGLFEIQEGDVELWLLPATNGSSGCPNALGSSLGPDEPISKVITTRDVKLQVEKLLFQCEEYLIASTAITHTTTVPMLDDDGDDNNNGVEVPLPSAHLLSTSMERRNDAEIARTLSVELNRRNTTATPAAVRAPIFSWQRTPRPRGTVVAQASCSQFSIAGGQSACTSICLYAASQFLSSMRNNNETTPQQRCTITTSVLDGYLQVGSALYQNVALRYGEDEYTSVDDLWNQSAFSSVVRSLVRGPPITTRSFEEGLVAAMSYAQSQGERSVALVVTKPPKTILLVCQNVNHQSADSPWFFFDSHGEDHQFLQKKAYVRQLDSIDTVVAELRRKFPAGRVMTRGSSTTSTSSLRKKQMNMYEAHPIVSKLNEKEQLDLETALALSNT